MPTFTRKHDATRIRFYVDFTIAEKWKGLVRLSSALRPFLCVFVALAMDILCASSYFKKNFTPPECA